jgi:hypothetical protein
MAPDREQPDAESERPPVPPAAGTPDPSPADLRRISEEISALYPPPRLGTELVLLEVNPHKAHAYWNIDIEDYRAAQIRSGLTHAPLVLRLYDITGVEFNGRNAHTAFDMEVQGLQGHWYLDLWKDGRTHLADIGFRTNDGSLVCLARSNPVSTPAATESSEYNTLAVDTGADTPPALRMTDLINDPNLSPQNLDAETGAPVPTGPDADYEVVPAAPFVAPGHVEEAAAPATVPFEPAPAAPEPAALQQDLQAWFDQAAEAAAATVARAPWQGPGHTPAGEPAQAPERSVLAAGWPTAEQLSAPVNGNSAAEEAAVSRAENEGWPTEDELARHVADTPGAAPALPPAPEAGPAPAPDPAPPVQAPAPGPMPTSLDSYVTLSSYEHQRREVALEVNVELHIYGRARPGTELTLYGQPVPLRPDGTFSVRKPLPNGAVVLPLLAVDPPPQNGA